MSASTSRRLRIGVCVTLITIWLQACELDLESHVASFERGRGAYEINSRTILQSIQQNSPDLFHPRQDDQENQAVDSLPVRWTQADYWQIVEIFHQQVLMESINDWKLDRMFFRLDCTAGSFGPQQEGFDLYKVLDAGEHRRLDRAIDILPKQEQLDWHDTELSPVRVDTMSIDLAQVKVPIEQAIQISERNGGERTRVKVDNQCVVYATLVSGKWDGGWRITYERLRGGPTLFQVTVDSRTGDFQIGPTQ